jgi:hypothetical protein
VRKTNVRVYFYEQIGLKNMGFATNIYATILPEKNLKMAAPET